jgi:hypothetical protein
MRRGSERCLEGRRSERNVGRVSENFSEGVRKIRGVLEEL